MIKRILLLTLITSTILLTFSFTKNKPAGANNGKGGIVFFTGTWKEALAKAKAENKIIFLDIYATWCGPCKKLKAKSFASAKVGTYFNDNFINVTLDGEEGEGIILAEKYKLQAYPTLLFIDGDGNVKKGAVGYYNPSELLSLGKAAK